MSIKTSTAGARLRKQRVKGMEAMFAMFVGVADYFEDDEVLSKLTNIETVGKENELCRWALSQTEECDWIEDMANLLVNPMSLIEDFGYYGRFRTAVESFVM